VPTELGKCRFRLKVIGGFRLVRVGDWGRTWAVEEVLGIDANQPGDDRLARALDAIAPKLEQIAGTVGARAIAEFGIDVSTLHWDMTSMSVHGAYPVEDQDEQYPVLKHGHPKDRRVDLKQVQAGLAVTGDGGVPVHARVFGGGAAEVSQVVGAMKDLQKMAGEQRFLLVADSKLVSYPNVAALLGPGCRSSPRSRPRRSRTASTPPWTWSRRRSWTGYPTATPARTPPSGRSTGCWRTSM
jgi:hypothetical protein